MPTELFVDVPVPRILTEKVAVVESFFSGASEKRECFFEGTAAPVLLSF